MNKILRYGMVGGGPGSFIGDAHRRAIALDSTAQLVAGVFSSHPEKSRQTALELGVDPARCYADYREMAEKEAARDDGIDFVVVVTPNVSHYEICKAFLNAGIHVSCDKPVTVTYAQAAELEGPSLHGDLHLYRPCDHQVCPGSGGLRRHRRGPGRHGGVSPGVAGP